MSSPSVTGHDRAERLGAATPRPSTAESTLIAGVIMPSPIRRPAPDHQRPEQHARAAVPAVVQEAVEGEDARPRRRSARAARGAAYFTETMIVSVQIDQRGRRRARPRPSAAGRHAEDLVHGVERRGADVAVDDAERAERERPDAALGRMDSALGASRWRVGLPPACGASSARRDIGVGFNAVTVHERPAPGNARPPRHLRPCPSRRFRPRHPAPARVAPAPALAPGSGMGRGRRLRDQS